MERLANVNILMQI